MLKLNPYVESLSKGTQELNEELAGVRANKAQKTAELEVAKLDEKIAHAEAAVHESSTRQDINFDDMLNKLDELALLERKREQFKEILAQLFPAEKG